MHVKRARQKRSERDPNSTHQRWGPDGFADGEGRNALRVAIAVLAFSIGCGPSDAPKDLDGVTHYLYREWNHAQPTVMQDGVLQLETLLTALDLEGALDGRSFAVTDLTKSDLFDVPWPMSRNPSEAIGSCVARRSKWPIEDQARYIAEVDQLDAEPSAKVYVRSFIDPTDPACFVAGTCPILITENDVTRENTLLKVSFVLHKHLRWVTLGTDRRAIAARSYTDQPWPGSKDGTALNQSYSIDVFLGEADGRSIRYQCSWSESDFNLAVDDDLQRGVLVGAVDDAFVATDTAIGKRYHGE